MRTLLILLIGTISAQAADMRIPKPKVVKENTRALVTPQAKPPAEVATPRHIGMP